MPPIFRHVVPNVPAWTAGNGAPCYRGNAPSCQALMKMAAVWSGDIDFGDYFDPDDMPTDPTITAANINAAITNWAQTGDATFYYNDATGLITPNPVPGLLLYYVDFNTGRYWIGSKSVTLRFRVGIFWDATFTDWKWGALITNLSASFDNGRAPVICARPYYALFASTPTTQKIRLGSGVTMPFNSLTTPRGDWRDAALANCSLTVSAQYA